MKAGILVVLAVAFTGCVSVHKNDGGNEIAHPRTFSKDAVQLSYKLEQMKVEATEKLHWLNLCFIGIPITFTWGGTADHVADYAPNGAKIPFMGPSIEETAKAGAYAMACTATGADYVVATRYRVTSKSYLVYGTATAYIEGVPAKVSKVELVDATKMPEK